MLYDTDKVLGSGVITFSEPQDKDKLAAVKDVLEDKFDVNGFKNELFVVTDLLSNEKMLDTLNKASKMVPIKSGEIGFYACFDGDFEYWRLIYKDGEWVEQDGKVSYDDDAPGVRYKLRDRYDSREEYGIIDCKDPSITREMLQNKIDELLARRPDDIDDTTWVVENMPAEWGVSLEAFVASDMDLYL